MVSSHQVSSSLSLFVMVAVMAAVTFVSVMVIQVVSVTVVSVMVIQVVSVTVSLRVGKAMAPPSRVGSKDGLTPSRVSSKAGLTPSRDGSAGGLPGLGGGTGADLGGSTACLSEKDATGTIAWFRW